MSKPYPETDGTMNFKPVLILQRQVKGKPQ
jgi:hypothetical protein